MLARARRVAARRGFDGAGLQIADVAKIRLADGDADICLLHSCLHCVADPRVALSEAVRCLKPGGTLLGSMLVRGASAKVDRLMDRDVTRDSPMMGPGGTAADLGMWLRAAGLSDVQLDTAGAMATFSARR